MFSAKLGGKHTVTRYPLPYIHTASLTSNIPYQSGAFVIILEFALTCFYHPKSIVYIVVIARCCGASILAQMIVNLTAMQETWV